MKHTVGMALFLVLLLPCCLAADATTTPQPVAPPALSAPHAEGLADAQKGPEPAPQVPPKPEWRNWASCFASNPCSGPGTGVSCTGVGGTSKPVCFSGDGFVSCNGQVTYCGGL
jgi:hypothetical protein